MFNLKKVYLIGFLSLFCLSAVHAAPSKPTPKAKTSGPELLGEYNDWIAYYYNSPQGIVCYIASTPKKDEGKYTRRGDVYAVITHRPSEKSFDVINFVAGYDYKSGSKVVVKIGNQTIDEIFTDADKAWAINEKIDKELIDAMKKGQRMIVHGTSSKGNTTKDTYSLSGFLSAYKAINSKCKR